MGWGVQYGQVVEIDRSYVYDLVPDDPRCPWVVTREVFLLYRPHAVREEIFLYVWEVVVHHYTAVVLPFPGCWGRSCLERELFVVDNLVGKYISRILFVHRADMVTASRL